MAYFIHNKYDSVSSSKVTLVSGTNYTYNADNTVTVIDYYGLLENGVTTYQYLDTTYMGLQTIDALTYLSIDTANRIGSNQTTDGKSIIEFASGIGSTLQKLQTDVGLKSDTGGSTNDGTIMAKLNAILDKLSLLNYNYNKVQPSEDIFAVLSTTEVSTSSSSTSTFNSVLSCAFHSDLSGTVKLGCEIRTSTHGNLYIRIMENDTTEVFKSPEYDISDFPEYGFITLDNIPVNQKNNYQVYLYASGEAGYTGVGYLKTVNLYAEYTNGPIEYVYKV